MTAAVEKISEDTVFLKALELALQEVSSHDINSDFFQALAMAERKDNKKHGVLTPEEIARSAAGFFERHFTFSAPETSLTNPRPPQVKITGPTFPDDREQEALLALMGDSPVSRRSFMKTFTGGAAIGAGLVAGMLAGQEHQHVRKVKAEKEALPETRENEPVREKLREELQAARHTRSLEISTAGGLIASGAAITAYDHYRQSKDNEAAARTDREETVKSAVNLAGALLARTPDILEFALKDYQSAQRLNGSNGTSAPTIRMGRMT